ncbi:MAG TPA: PhzF family phenazine biosynthesis protein [Actinomycetota bacterium]
MSVPVFWVDAFTDRAFAGNPAAVCLLEKPADEAWMAAVAREMNLSETAFVSPRGGGDHDLRWFTPTVEVDLCGHATLASAFTLWQEKRVPSDASIAFHSRSGVLRATRPGDDVVELDLPADPLTPAGLPDAAALALGAEPLAVWHGRIGYVVELASEEAVRALAPDFGHLAEFPDDGFVVTASSSDDVDFVSRFFVPSAGIDEDPVTGAAHCALGPLWCERLGRDEVVGYQASARGGIVRCRRRGDRVALLGHAVMVARGELLA